MEKEISSAIDRAVEFTKHQPLVAPSTAFESVFAS